METNVLGTELQPCSKFPMTGFFRDGYCRTCQEDVGRHTVCVQVTDEFLAHQKQVGNDLSTPLPQFDFPGLVAGDRWCVCALRWKQAYDDGVVGSVVLESTHSSVLDIMPLAILEEAAVAYEANQHFPDE